MAATSRYGSMVLSRIASPPTRLSSAQARAFSTTLALRFNASVIYQNGQQRTPTPKPRLNPLVGNYVPEPTPKPSPKPIAESQADFIPPPPPPPPLSSESQQASAQEDSSKSEHPYNAAAESSTLFPLDIAAIIGTKAAAFGQSLGMGDPLQRPKIRAKAVTGRTVFIKDRLTPTSAPTPAVAIRVLEKMCRDQKVKNKFHTQKFHERKGLKKKRLRSQRWRARFKTGFKAAVSKVMELKKQGW